MMVTIVLCYMSICDIAAVNVNELLLCGYMYIMLATVDGDNRTLSYVNMSYGGRKR